MATERFCIVCKQKYEYCDHCGEYSKYPKWMASFDKEECHEVYNAVSAYNMGLIDKDKVEKVLKTYNVTDFSKYNDGLANKLNELFPPKKVVEVVDPDKVEEKPTSVYRNRRYRKTNTEEEANTEE